MALFRKTDPTLADSASTVLSSSDAYFTLLAQCRAHIRSLQRNNSVWMGSTVLLLVALVMLFPLQKRIPFFYEADSCTGNLSLSHRVVEEMTWSDQQIAYFLRLWAARVVTINAASVKEGLPSAYKWLRGGAQQELDDWVDKTDKTLEKISKHPGITREIVGLPTVSFNEDRTVAFIDFVWVEKVGGTETERKRKLLALDFGTVKPKREADMDPDNPLGLAITHFTLQDVVSK